MVEEELEEAAEATFSSSADVAASIEDGTTEWGAAAFASQKRRRLRIRQVPEGQVNFLVLGPAGAGKSSLIMTACRALSLTSSVEDAELRVGQQGELKAEHGTTCLSSHVLQRPPEATTKIVAQDTKGGQFYDEHEREFAERLVDGFLRGGSTQERESLHFWALLSKAGLGSFVRRAELKHSPHAVVLVFDATLRSLSQSLNDHDSPLLACYREVAGHARRSGLETFAVLTHVDVYEKRREDDREERRVGETVSASLKQLSADLSKAFGDDVLPPRRVFPVANYQLANSPKNVSFLSFV